MRASRRLVGVLLYLVPLGCAPGSSTIAPPAAPPASVGLPGQPLPPAEPCPSATPPPVGPRAVSQPAAVVPASAQGQPVLGRDGDPLARPAPGRYTSGGVPCPPRPGGTCDLRERQVCAVHDLVQCAAGCEGYRTQAFECKAGLWRATGTTEAPCVCKPELPRSALSSCTLRYLRVQPSDMSQTDQCAAALLCDGHDLWVECDAEQDGTGSSLCSCWRDRTEVQGANSGLASREGAEACFEAAASCAAAPSSSRR